MIQFLLSHVPETVYAMCVAGLGVLFRMLYREMKRAQNRQKAIEDALKLILRDRITQAYYHFEENGWITLHGKTNVSEMYDGYHALGGNGPITDLVNDLKELPVKEKERHSESKGD